MEATATIQKNPIPAQTKTPISWETFEADYLTREDGNKYEWVNGMVEITPNTMNKTQIQIFLNLLAIFHKLLFEGKVHGGLIPEADLFFVDNHRKPDIAWLTDEQAENLENVDAYEAPTFVIEVISSNDVMNKVEDKMEDYRAAKVQVVWHIFPKHKTVHVYTGEHLEKMIVCRGEDISSAAPALPNFEIPTAQIFTKTSKLKSSL